LAQPIFHAPVAAYSDAPLAALAAADARLRRALARIAGFVVACRAWEPLGYVRAGDYARERAGMSGRELLDLAAVDARLAELPRIEAAFVAGEISWTKARLLCRAATPDDEGEWLAAAARMSAARLAREVRAIDVRGLEVPATDESGAPEEPRQRIRIRCARWTLASWGNVCRLARRMHGAHVSEAEVAEAVAAEVVSALPLEVDPESLPMAAEVRRARRQAAGEDAPVLPPPGGVEPGAVRAPFLDALVEGLATATPRELDARLRRAAALERSFLARLGPPLLELAATRAYRNVGCRSFDQYARERLGMAPRKARTLLRVERACQVSVHLRTAWRAGALTLAQAQTLVSLFTLDRSMPWQEAWIARAGQVTLRRLCDDVDAVIASGNLDPAALPALPADLQSGARHKDSEDTPQRPDERDRLSLWAPEDVARLFRAAHATVQRRIGRAEGRPCTPGEALEVMLHHVSETWRLRSGGQPREQRIMQRDGWRCTVPGCTSYRNLHAHHVVFRSAGGSDDAENLTTLCAAHHQRGVHGGGPGPLRISGRAPAELHFELPLESFASGDVRLRRGQG
jgi:hypothetical protein